MYPTTTPLKAAVIVVSDRISSGLKPDHAADSAVEMFQGADVEISHREIVREEEAAFSIALQSRLQAGDDIIVTLGGAGRRGRKGVADGTGRPLCAGRHVPDTQDVRKG